MSNNRVVVLTILAASLVAGAPAGAQAQKDIASCKALLDANAKMFTTPSHMYMTVSSAVRGGKVDTSETIWAGSSIYVMVDGKWERSPINQPAMLKQQQENVRDAKAYSCRRLRDESVNGTAATVYGSHSETEYSRADAQTWIAKGSGLILRQEEDLDTGGPGKTHMSLRYEYTNVGPPAGVN